MASSANAHSALLPVATAVLARLDALDDATTRPRDPRRPPARVDVSTLLREPLAAPVARHLRGTLALLASADAGAWANACDADGDLPAVLAAVSGIYAAWLRVDGPPAGAEDTAVLQTALHEAAASALAPLVAEWCALSAAAVVGDEVSGSGGDDEDVNWVLRMVAPSAAALHHASDGRAVAAAAAAAVDGENGSLRARRRSLLLRALLASPSVGRPLGIARSLLRLALLSGGGGSGGCNDEASGHPDRARAPPSAAAIAARRLTSVPARARGRHLASAAAIVGDAVDAALAQLRSSEAEALSAVAAAPKPTATSGTVGSGAADVAAPSPSPVSANQLSHDSALLSAPDQSLSPALRRLRAGLSGCGTAVTSDNALTSTAGVPATASEDGGGAAAALLSPAAARSLLVSRFVSRHGASWGDGSLRGTDADGESSSELGAAEADAAADVRLLVASAALLLELLGQARAPPAPNGPSLGAPSPVHDAAVALAFIRDFRSSAADDVGAYHGSEDAVDADADGADIDGGLRLWRRSLGLLHRAFCDEMSGVSDGRGADEDDETIAIVRNAARLFSESAAVPAPSTAAHTSDSAEEAAELAALVEEALALLRSGDDPKGTGAEAVASVGHTESEEEEGEGVPSSVAELRSFLSESVPLKVSLLPLRELLSSLQQPAPRGGRPDATTVGESDEDEGAGAPSAAVAFATWLGARLAPLRLLSDPAGLGARLAPLRLLSDPAAPTTSGGGVRVEGDLLLRDVPAVPEQREALRRTAERLRASLEARGYGWVVDDHAALR
jgi:hypothetical protein